MSQNASFMTDTHLLFHWSIGYRITATVRLAGDQLFSARSKALISPITIKITSLNIQKEYKKKQYENLMTRALI